MLGNTGSIVCFSWKLSCSHRSFQFFTFTKNKEIQFNDDKCLDAPRGEPGTFVEMITCHGLKGNQEWKHNKKKVIWMILYPCTTFPIIMFKYISKSNCICLFGSFVMSSLRSFADRFQIRNMGGLTQLKTKTTTTTNKFWSWIEKSEQDSNHWRESVKELLKTYKSLLLAAPPLEPNASSADIR